MIGGDRKLLFEAWKDRGLRNDDRRSIVRHPEEAPDRFDVAGLGVKVAHPANIIGLAPTTNIARSHIFLAEAEHQ
jgi:hypothetical protein